MMKFISSLVLALLLVVTSSVGATPSSGVHQYTQEEIIATLEDKDAHIPDAMFEQFDNFDVEIVRQGVQNENRALRGNEGRDLDEMGEPFIWYPRTRTGTGTYMCNMCDEDYPELVEICRCNRNEDSLCRYCYAIRFDAGNLCKKYCWRTYV